MVAHGTDVADDNVSDPTPGAPGAEVEIPSDAKPTEPLAGSRGVETIDYETGEVVPAGESGLMFAEVIGDAGIEAYLSDMSATEDDSPEAIQLEIARRILSADSVDAVWAATKVLTAKEVLNTPIIVERVRWITSAHKGGAPKFAIFEGTNVYTQAPITVSCGALNVVLTLYKLQKHGGLPAKVMLSSKPSSSDAGRSVITIAPVAG